MDPFDHEVGRPLILCEGCHQPLHDEDQVIELEEQLVARTYGHQETVLGMHAFVHPGHRDLVGPGWREVARGTLAERKAAHGGR